MCIGYVYCIYSLYLQYIHIHSFLHYFPSSLVLSMIAIIVRYSYRFQLLHVHVRLFHSSEGYKFNFHYSPNLRVMYVLRISFAVYRVVDIANSNNCWSAGRHTHPSAWCEEAQLVSTWKLKEEGIINTIWIAGWDNGAYLFTKNLPGRTFNNDGRAFLNFYFGKDEYLHTTLNELGVGSR